jgi:hypothetical protein
VSQPHAQSKWNKRWRKPSEISKNGRLRIHTAPADPSDRADHEQGNDAQGDQHSDRHHRQTPDPKVIHESLLERNNGRCHPSSVHNCREEQHEDDCCQVGTLTETPNSRATTIVDQLSTSHGRNQGNVVVWARIRAVETKRAIHVATLFRLKQRRLTPNSSLVSRNAVFGRAGLADMRVLDGYRGRRDHRMNEVELPYRTDKLAKRRVHENSIKEKHEQENSDGDDCSPKRSIP